MHTPTAPQRARTGSGDGRTRDVNAVVAHNLRTIRRLRGLTQQQAAERLAVFTGNRPLQASISAMERAFDSGRRRLFDAQTLYLLSRVFDVPIIYFFLPPADCLDHTLDGTNEPVASLLESSLGAAEALPIIDRRLVEITPRPGNGHGVTGAGMPAACVQRWQHDLRRLTEVDCNARLREIADLLRVLTDLHGVGADA